MHLGGGDGADGWGHNPRFLGYRDALLGRYGAGANPANALMGYYHPGNPPVAPLAEPLAEYNAQQLAGLAAGDAQAVRNRLGDLLILPPTREELRAGAAAAALRQSHVDFQAENVNTSFTVALMPFQPSCSIPRICSGVQTQLFSNLGHEVNDRWVWVLHDSRGVSASPVQENPLGSHYLCAGASSPSSVFPGLTTEVYSRVIVEGYKFLQGWNGYRRADGRSYMDAYLEDCWARGMYVAPAHK
jgi:hypothetical protein